jgi:hypothetical protein
MNNRDIIPLTPTHGNNTTAAAAPVGAPPLPTTTTTTTATTIGTTTSSSFKWTEEASIALAEEVGNCRAHVPPHGQTEKLWKDVQASLNARGFRIQSHRTVQRRFEKQFEDFKKTSSKRASTSGVEEYSDDDNPLVGLMEDLYQEVLDHQAEKERKKEEDRNKEAQLVAGGKQIRDRVATMIVGGERIVMGGSEVTLNDLREPSPAMSMFGSETDGSTAATSKRSRDEVFLLEVMDADRKRRRAEEVVAMERHRDEMNMRMQELQVSREHNTILLTSLQAQLQQNQTMNELLQNQNKIQMSQLELKLKKFADNTQN